MCPNPSPCLYFTLTDTLIELHVGGEHRDDVLTRDHDEVFGGERARILAHEVCKVRDLLCGDLSAVRELKHRDALQVTARLRL